MAKKTAAKKKRTAAQKRATEKLVAANKKRASKKKASARTGSVSTGRRSTKKVRGYPGGARRTNPATRRYVISVPGFLPSGSTAYVYGYDPYNNTWELTGSIKSAMRGTKAGMEKTAVHVHDELRKAGHGAKADVYLEQVS